MNGKLLNAAERISARLLCESGGDFLAYQFADNMGGRGMGGLPASPGGRVKGRYPGLLSGNPGAIPGDKRFIPWNPGAIPGNGGSIPWYKRFMPGNPGSVPGYNCFIPRNPGAIPGNSDAMPGNIITQGGIYG
jgi:hypothetical protein